MRNWRWLAIPVAALAGNTSAQVGSPTVEPTPVVILDSQSASTLPTVATEIDPSPVVGFPAVEPSTVAVRTIDVSSLPPTQISNSDAAAFAEPIADLPGPVIVMTDAPVDDPQFPHLEILKPAVAFWTRVFAEWSEHQSVVHSIDDLGKVYTVLDFRADAAVLSPNALDALKSREEKQAYIDLAALLEQLQTLQDKTTVPINPDQLTPAQRQVYELYADSSDPQRFRKAIGRFRIQRGLRERTLLALQTSGRYLPEMESIFTAYGLPTKLTRLPLVESSFNIDAYSKSAAAGLWQFIPSAARIYMRLNELVDDRRDPWLSTDAAARHLKDDYAALGSWPLALTAYNYGPGGLVRALDEVNGTSLTDVLARFHGERFGFAASNFYAEFLAASDVERDYRKHFGEVVREPPLHYDTVNTRDYVAYETLRKLSGSDDEEFHRLNPAYRPEVVEGKLYVPPGHEIRVPAGAAERFQLAYATLTSAQRFDRQRQFYTSHQVVRGESVGALAQRYGVSTTQILAANGLSNVRRVRAGQTLKIPPRDAGILVASETPAPVHVIKVKTVAVTTAQARTHRVKSGQTLDALAKRYRTTIQSLRELNGFGESDVLRAGSTIRVPGG